MTDADETVAPSESVIQSVTSVPSATLTGFQLTEPDALPTWPKDSSSFVASPEGRATMVQGGAAHV